MPDFVVQLSEQGNVMNDSVLPIVKAGLQELVESNHRVTDEVSLFPTPGHTPGHVSVAISSAGQKADHHRRPDAQPNPDRRPGDLL